MISTYRRRTAAKDESGSEFTPLKNYSGIDIYGEPLKIFVYCMTAGVYAVILSFLYLFGYLIKGMLTGLFFDLCFIVYFFRRWKE